MRKGPCEMPRLEQLRTSLPGELLTLIHLLSTGSVADAASCEPRLAYIKQVFDACGEPVPYKPLGLSRMAWGDMLDILVERYGEAHLCPVCRHLLDVPTYQYGEIVCLRGGCSYHVRMKGGSDGFDFDPDGL